MQDTDLDQRFRENSEGISRCVKKAESLELPEIRLEDGQILLNAGLINDGTGAIILDVNMRIVYINKAVINWDRDIVAKIQGIDPEKITYKTFVGTKCYKVYGRTSPCEGCPVVKALEAGNSVFFGTYPHLAGPRAITALPLFDVVTHKVIGLIKFSKKIEDINQRRRLSNFAL